MKNLLETCIEIRNELQVAYSLGDTKSARWFKSRIDRLTLAIEVERAWTETPRRKDNEK